MPHRLELLSRIGRFARKYQLTGPTDNVIGFGPPKKPPKRSDKGLRMCSRRQRRGRSIKNKFCERTEKLWAQNVGIGTTVCRLIRPGLPTEQVEEIEFVELCHKHADAREMKSVGAGGCQLSSSWLGKGSIMKQRIDCSSPTRTLKTVMRAQSLSRAPKWRRDWPSLALNYP